MMGVFDLYSKRQQRNRGEVPDVYVYDHIPEALRVQIIHIWDDTIGNSSDYQCSNTVRELYENICKALCREYGVFILPPSDPHRNEGYRVELGEFLLQEGNYERVLDVVELSFRMIHLVTRRYEYQYEPGSGKRADNAIDELNARFREHGVGYQFVDGEIIRVDSELLHSEVVKPALTVLRNSEYSGAQEEFLRAYEHYRHGNSKEALNECLKCFESLMKAICDKRKWPYDKNATAKRLIQTCLDKGLLPSFWQNHYTSLSSVLESGVPTGRNKMSGHGQGAKPIQVPPHYVAYMLHMTASAIVFLTDADKELS